MKARKNQRKDINLSINKNVRQGYNTMIKQVNPLLVIINSIKATSLSLMLIH